MTSRSTVAPLPPLTLDDRRGTMATWLFISTEGLLFVSLFFAYYYLGADAPRWPAAEPPGLHFALPMLGVLLVSSAILHAGERRMRRNAPGAARLAVAAAILLGVAFLVLQGFEYAERLRSLSPRANAYASVFYTIASFHAAHLVLGLLMLMYVLPVIRGSEARPPHRPLHNAALYWHFVVVVWIVIVSLLYVYPNLDR